MSVNPPPNSGPEMLPMTWVSLCVPPLLSFFHLLFPRRNPDLEFCAYHSLFFKKTSSRTVHAQTIYYLPCL